MNEHVRRQPVDGPEPIGSRPLKPWQVYLFATVATVATLALRLSLDGLLRGQPTLVIFTVAITISAYLGGWRGGILATALSLFLVCYFVLPPIYSFYVASVADRWQLFFILMAGAVTSTLSESLHRAHTRADNAVREGLETGKALSRANQQLRLFADHAPAAIAMLDTQLHYIAASERWLADFGLVGQDLPGRSHYEMFPDLPARWKEIHRRCLAGAVERADEDLFVRTDGTEQWLRWEVRPWHDASGAVGGIVIFSEDVTERKRTSDALRLSEERFRLLVEGVTEYAIIQLDIEGRVVGWNAGAERIKGYKGGEICGRSFTVFYPPEDVAAGKPMTELKLAAEKGECVDEGWRVRADGTRFWANVVITALKDNAGNLRGFAKLTRDITERKQMEEALRTSEARVGGIVNSAMDAIISVDSEQRVVLFNVAAEKIFGCTAQVALGQLIGKFIPERFRERHRHQIKDFAATGVTSRSMRSLNTLSGLRADGEEFPIEASISQVEVGGQRIFTVILRDITERQRTDSAARLLGLIVNSSSDAIIGKDLNGIVTTWNAAAQRVFGYSAQEMIGRSITCIIPPDRQEDEEMILSRIRRGESVEHFETERLKKDGGRISISVTVSPIKDSHGAVIGASKVARDITERRQADDALRKSEAQLLATVENIDEAVVVSDLNGQLLHFNHAALGMLGYASPDEGRRNFSELADTFDLSDVDGTAWAVDQWPMARILRGEKLVDLEARMRRKKAAWERVYSFSGTLAEDTDGKPLMAILTFSDITDRKRIEHEIRLLNKDLEQRVAERTAQMQAANKELESFSYSVSHDLRAPLRSLDGFSQALLEDYGDKLDAQGRDYLSRIRTSSQRMGQLIDDLLNLSRVSRGEITREMVNLSKMTLDVANELRASTPQRDAEFVIADGLTAQTDPRLLRIVITNLLGNAWKFTAKRPHARIEFGCSAENGCKEYFLRDNGAGFDPRYSSNLFGAFQRLHAAKDYPGTGIGLATVQRILHRQGGKIWAEGKVDQGATFHFTLGEAQK